MSNTKTLFKKSLWKLWRRHPATILFLAAGIPLTLLAGEIFGIGACILAALSYLLTRIAVARSADADPGPATVDGGKGSFEIFSSVDQLAAGIAHEINNPLAIISQELEWVGHLLEAVSHDSPKELEECRDSLREISRQVTRCKEVVQRLLSLARQMNPIVQSVDLNHLVGEVADLCSREASARNIRIVKRLEPDLPRVASDPPLLRQVFLNLLANAAHAVGRDGLITIATSCGTDGLVEVQVTDDGCGIPAENLNKVFAPFFTTKPEGKGSGLGLAICRAIVERLRGNLSVTSEAGCGTSFTVRLPPGDASPPVHAGGRGN
jgi:signal transduction histidine kinase